MQAVAPGFPGARLSAAAGALVTLRPTGYDGVGAVSAIAGGGRRWKVITRTILRNTVMMTLQKVADYMLAEPFRPFRIKMASGQAFEIRHPEMIMVGRSSARVYTATDDNEHEKWHDVSLLLMETIEPLDATLQK
jgi:hypothetical protein